MKFDLVTLILGMWRRASIESLADLSYDYPVPGESACQEVKNVFSGE